MQTVNALVALGGFDGSKVAVLGITVAELAVLREIHGEHAVTNIEPAGEVNRTDRAELARLHEIYGRNIEGRIAAPAVTRLYPGAASRVFHTLDELDLPEELFAATGRAGGKPLSQVQPDLDKELNMAPPAKGADVEDVEDDVEDNEDNEDGVEDMPPAPEPDPEPARERRATRQPPPRNKKRSVFK